MSAFMLFICAACFHCQHDFVSSAAAVNKTFSVLLQSADSAFGAKRFESSVNLLLSHRLASSFSIINSECAVFTGEQIMTRVKMWLQKGKGM